MIIDAPRAKSILALSLPMVLVLFAQNLMSLLTIAMVGRLGDAALAGAGVGGALFAMLLAILFGIDTGAQAVVARRSGEGRLEHAGAVLNDAIALSVAAGLLLTTIGYGAAAALLRVMTHDPAVVAEGMPYLATSLPMLAFLGANFAFTAYWNGIGAPKFSLLAILVQLACHGVFSYMLIFGALGAPRLAMAGAGLAATLAALAALMVHVALALGLAPIPGFLRRAPELAGMRTILAIGFPISIQQSLVYLGTSVYFAIVGLLGTQAVAAANVMLAMLLISILAATGVGIAAATLVGRALGRQDAADAKRWGWEASSLGALAIFGFSLLIILSPRSILGLFIDNAPTIDLTVAPIRVLALGMGVDAFGRILGFALRGAGATKAVTTVAFVLQWGVQLPLCWYIGVHLGYGLLGISANRLVLFAVEAAIVAMIWQRGRWSLIRIPLAEREAPGLPQET